MSIKEIEKVLEFNFGIPLRAYVVKCYSVNGLTKQQKESVTELINEVATEISRIPCQRCKDIKYLDRAELEKAIKYFAPYGCSFGSEIAYEPVINTILKLAIPGCKKCKELEGVIKDMEKAYRKTNRYLQDSNGEARKKIQELKTEIDRLTKLMAEIDMGLGKSLKVINK